MIVSLTLLNIDRDELLGASNYLRLIIQMYEKYLLLLNIDIKTSALESLNW